MGAQGVAGAACPPTCLPASLPPCLFSCPSLLPTADAYGVELLRTELIILDILHSSGCGSRVVKPLATVRWPGRWYEDPQMRASRWFQVSLASDAAPGGRAGGEAGGGGARRTGGWAGGPPGRQAGRQQSAPQASPAVRNYLLLTHPLLRPFPAAAHTWLCHARVRSGVSGKDPERHLLPVSGRAAWLPGCQGWTMAAASSPPVTLPA